MKINFTKKQKGYALLMAVMVSSLFLIIAGTVAKIAAVEIILSSIGRESQLAFYAADAGIECALYWDRHYTAVTPFVPTDNSGSAFSVINSNDPSYVSDAASIASPDGTSNRELIRAVANNGSNGTRIVKCAGSTVTGFDQGNPFVLGGGLTAETFFSVRGMLGGSCADVVVTKSVAGASLVTKIVARGYNTCDLTNPRRLERALQVVSQ